MKLSKTLTLLIMLAFSASLILSGCQGEPQTELTPSHLACIEMMQKVPVYYEDFEFWDVKTLRSDPDLGEMYQIWYERKIAFLEERYGIKSSGIDYLAQGEGLLDIIKTDYDIKALRDRIAVDFYRDTSYEDMEVWKNEPSYDPQDVTGGWVLTEGLLVNGANNSNVDDYLRVTRGEELSMYDKNAAEVLDRLPEGIMIRIIRSTYPEGLVVSGDSVEKVEGSTFRWTNVYKFESPEDVQSADAEKYFKGIEDDFNQAESELTRRGESSPLHDFSLEYDGEFVKWSTLIEEKYMIALLFYG
jgi:hypothetical protein